MKKGKLLVSGFTHINHGKIINCYSDINIRKIKGGGRLMNTKREYFTELYGNDAVKSRLGSAIDNVTLPHAFLILGPDGSGKKTLASLLTMALNCVRKNDKGAPLPCGVCNTCRRIREGNFTDITRLSKSD